MADGGDHFSDPGPGVLAERELVVVEEDLELRRHIGSRKVDAFVP